MSNTPKRSYNSKARLAQAAQTRNRILGAAKTLFATEGFECTTIEKLAQTAEVSIPTIYGLFQSKRGVLRALMDEAFAPDQFEELVQDTMKQTSPTAFLAMSAKIARNIYDAERAQMDIFRSASGLAPELKELEQEREKRRHERQEESLKKIANTGSIKPEISLTKARDILWALTGRDLYRMLVIEQGWSSDDYERWLSEILARSLLQSKNR